MPEIIHFSRAEAETQVDYPRPDRLLSEHNPRRLTRNFYTDPSGMLSAGEWRCEPGRWRIAFAANKMEYFHVLSGSLCIESEAGDCTNFQAGEGGVIPAGFRGVFTVLTPVRKHYVVLETRETTSTS